MGAPCPVSIKRVCILLCTQSQIIFMYMEAILYVLKQSQCIVCISSTDYTIKKKDQKKKKMNKKKEDIKKKDIEKKRWKRV